MKTISYPITASAQLIRDHYLERRAKNASYSLRAFARDLGVSHALLSLVMNGKHKLTPQMAARLAISLNLPAETQGKMISESLKPRRGKRRDRAGTQIFWDLDVERFRSLSQWYHLAILELTLVKNFEPETNWIARRLGINPIEAQDAVDRLLRLGLLIEDGESIRKSKRLLNIKSAGSAQAIRNYHIGAMERATRELRERPESGFETRWIGGGSVTVPRSQVARARAKLKKFQEEFIQEFSSLENPEEVYQLNLQFFPLTQES